MDFEINIQRDGEIRILQITDMQVIDASQERYKGRLSGDQPIWWATDKKEENLYGYLKELVGRTNPDLIIITGDITYGEFDDSGKSQMEFIEFMDSFEIPWAPVYGNHDNETYMGIDWQNEQYENAKYCLFKKGEVFGNGNYSIGIKQNGALKRIICMMDSNGCGKLEIKAGFRDDQISWLKKAAGEQDVPAFVCFHIPNRDFADALIAKGYQDKYDTRDDFTVYELGKDMPSKDGDFGRKHERLVVDSEAQPLMPLFKECGIDGVFVGHDHKTNTCVLYEGIRFVFGLKTGKYDYHEPDAMGGTLIRLNGSDFTVCHEYCK